MIPDNSLIFNADALMENNPVNRALAASIATQARMAGSSLRFILKLQIMPLFKFDRQSRGELPPLDIGIANEVRS
jgi:hypothetical protein